MTEFVEFTVIGRMIDGKQNCKDKPFLMTIKRDVINIAGEANIDDALRTEC